MIPQSCRRLGEVFATGAYSAVSDVPSTESGPPTRFLSDWALVDIDARHYTASQSEKFESPWLEWLNRFHGPSWDILPSDKAARSRANPQYWANTRINDPNDRRLQCLKISEELSDEPGFYNATKVAKHGATTGFTDGDAVGAPAVLPRLNPKPQVASKDEYTWSTQLVVVRKDTKTPFSKPGDSGAAVINEDGQVIGMLIGGFVPPKGTQGEKTEESNWTKDEKMLEQRVTELFQ
ncbi:hypothetical protein CC79DRAFT_1397857 [Sarocladium strictum]